MVVDLQGVNYILTDPQIHTRSDHHNRFGLGNLGMDGMTAFFCTHSCNEICKRMKLIGFKGDKGKSTIAAEALDPHHVVTRTLEEALAEKTMNLSCKLCGDIFCTERKHFMEHAANKRALYCTGCMDKIKGSKSRKQAKCLNCRRPYDYSPYWYSMIGMEAPKTCKSCKERFRKSDST